MFVSFSVTQNRSVELDASEFVELMDTHGVPTVEGQATGDRLYDAIGVHGEFTAELIKLSDIEDEDVVVDEVTSEDDEDEPVAVPAWR